MDESMKRPLSSLRDANVPRWAVVAGTILTGVAILPFVGMVAGVAGAFLAPLLPLAVPGLVPAFSSAVHEEAERRDARERLIARSDSTARAEERHERVEPPHRRAA